MEIIKKLADLAGRLDDAGLSYLADDIDAIASSLVKTAQYVGSQGYWVRNSRCWSNCYRQKRASSPSLSAQEVWQECQKEYVSSLEKGDDKWDKYASADAIVKTASYKEADRKFASTVATKTASGVELPVAVFETIAANEQEIQSEVVNLAARLSKVASRLSVSSAHQPLAIEAANLAQELVKVAGPFDFARGLANTVGRGVGQAANAVGNWARNQNAQGVANRQGKALSQSYQNLLNALTAWESALNGARQEIVGLQGSKNPQVAQRALQANQLLNQIHSIRLPAQQQMAQIQNTVTQLNQIMQGQGQGQGQGQQAPSAPTNTAPAQNAAVQPLQPGTPPVQGAGIPQPPPPQAPVSPQQNILHPSVMPTPPAGGPITSNQAAPPTATAPAGQAAIPTNQMAVPPQGRRQIFGPNQNQPNNVLTSPYQPTTAPQTFNLTQEQVNGQPPAPPAAGDMTGVATSPYKPQHAPIPSAPDVHTIEPNTNQPPQQPVAAPPGNAINVNKPGGLGSSNFTANPNDAIKAPPGSSSGVSDMGLNGPTSPYEPPAAPNMYNLNEDQMGEHGFTPFWDLSKPFRKPRPRREAVPTPPPTASEVPPAPAQVVPEPVATAPADVPPVAPQPQVEPQVPAAEIQPPGRKKRNHMSSRLNRGASAEENKGISKVASKSTRRLF